MDDARMTVQCAEKELEVDCNGVGEDHSNYNKGFEVVERLKEAIQTSAPLPKCVGEWFAEPFADSCDDML